MSDTLPPRQGSGDETSHDEDPLAELARIVAGEAEQGQSNSFPEQDASASVAQIAGEDAFDLEAQMEQVLQAEGFVPAIDAEHTVVTDDSAADVAVQQGDSFEDELISALQSEVETDPTAPVEETEVADVAVEVEPELLPEDAHQADVLDDSDEFENALADELLNAELQDAEASSPVAEQDFAEETDAHTASTAFEPHAPVFEPQAIEEPHPQELTGELVSEAAVLTDDLEGSSEVVSDYGYQDGQVDEFDTPEPYAEASFEAGFGKELEAELDLNAVDAGDADGGWQRDDMQVSNAEFAQAAAVDPDVNTGASHSVDPMIYQQENELQPTQQDFSYAEPEQRKSSSMRIAFVALAFAVIAGGAVAGYGLFGGNNGTGEPVLIKADNTPIKVKPEEPGGRQIANEENASYGKVDGKDETVDQTKLVSKTEEPADVAKVQDEQSSDLAQKANDRLSSEDVKADTNGSGRAGNVRPRVVKTVRVRADGSIIASQTASPIPTPTLASIDGAKSNGKTAIPAASPIAKKQVAIVAPTVTAPAPAAKPEEVVIPVPVSTPAPAPAPAPSAPKPVVQESEWVVQVSSVKSQEQANATFKNLQRRFAALADRQMAVQRANVNGNTFFRVRVQTASKNDASALCSNLKAAGGSCFITR